MYSSALFLSHVSVQRMQIAIFFYYFCLSVCPMPILYPNQWIHRHTFWLSG